MSTIHITYRHGLDRCDTRARIDEIARVVKHRYKVNYVWEGNRLFSNHKGSWVLVHLGEDSIELKIKLGLMLLPLKRKIESTISRNLHGVLSGQKDLLAHPALSGQGSIL